MFAMHGLIPAELADLSQPALALSNPKIVDEKSEDGLLTLTKILGLKLQADWVVLSACNTASADGQASEAVSGLGCAFFCWRQGIAGVSLGGGNGLGSSLNDRGV
jgi:CHAT domain-containing protein